MAGGDERMKSSRWQKYTASNSLLFEKPRRLGILATRRFFCRGVTREYRRECLRTQRYLSTTVAVLGRTDSINQSVPFKAGVSRAQNSGWHARGGPADM